MRDIKFRMWNGVPDDISKSKYFYDTENVFECLKQQCLFNEHGSYPFSYDHIGECGNSFEQFTGCYDINNIEIYENDILVDDNGSFFRVYHSNGGFVIKADYWKKDLKDLNNSDILILESLSDAQTQSYIKNSCEVVGNIHENEELLN